MPFGMRNAGPQYSRLAMHIERGINRPDVAGYMDDQVAFTEDFEMHIEAKDGLLGAHEKYGILLNPKRTMLFRYEFNLLGFLVNEKGVHPTSDWLEKIQTWPLPKTQKELMAFLRFVQYYSGFIPEFAHVTASLNSIKARKKL